MTEKARLHYFRATGRGNALRLALAAAQIPFEDAYPSGVDDPNKFGGWPPTDDDRAKWRALGGNATTNVPMLEMPDGKVYTQSSAVLRAVGRMGRLLPDDDEGLYKVDKLIADAADLREASYKCFVTWGAPQESADNFINTVLPLHLGNLERQLKQSDGGYFVGDSLTIADVACYDAVVNFGSNRVPAALDEFPTLAAWKERVESNAGIKAYLASEAYEGLGKFGPETVGK